MLEVELIISNEYSKTKVTIKSNSLSEDIEKAVNFLENIESSDINQNTENSSIIPVKHKGNISILHFKDISMIRSENNQVRVYTNQNTKKDYITNKRLYELEKILDDSFIRISKSVIVNLNQIDFVAPSFSGTMVISLKNGLKDNISRKYLPLFKKRLGLN
ncbi:MAG: LytTR family transcriptional regulator [Methanobrevibacter sp.]|jgi:DNA-binding LytR/AlgR family response regulator|nr:LytTR family transcriptional regulator [Methanobrevibacter sp.]